MSANQAITEIERIIEQLKSIENWISILCEDLNDLKREQTAAHN